jgi:hypothetical protein
MSLAQHKRQCIANGNGWNPSGCIWCEYILLLEEHRAAKHDGTSFQMITIEDDES